MHLCHAEMLINAHARNEGQMLHLHDGLVEELLRNEVVRGNTYHGLVADGVAVVSLGKVVGCSAPDQAAVSDAPVLVKTLLVSLGLCSFSFEEICVCCCEAAMLDVS